MIRALIVTILALVAAPVAAQKQDGPAPQVAAGTIVDLGVVQSKFTDPRRVVVWLPSGYDPKGAKQAVLYMHDGQNLFDTKTAGYGMEWQIDETLDRLTREKKVRPTIVVGIWSTPKRLQEYVPSKAFNGLPAEYRDKVRALYGGEPLSDGYLQFLVKELKPAIDARVDGRAHLALRDRRISGRVRRRRNGLDALAAGHQSGRQARERRAVRGRFVHLRALSLPRASGPA